MRHLPCLRQPALPLTDDLSLSGAATTLYCCLKALPSDCYHFFQDCSASPNRLPQADDDQASQKLYVPQPFPPPEHAALLAACAS